MYRLDGCSTDVLMSTVGVENFFYAEFVSFVRHGSQCCHHYRVKPSVVDWSMNDELEIILEESTVVLLKY